MYYACVNHLHTTQIVIIMKGCLQQPLPRNLFSDVWHMVRHVRTQRIDVKCIVQPKRTCNSVTFGRYAQLKFQQTNMRSRMPIFYITEKQIHLDILTSNLSMPWNFVPGWSAWFGGMVCYARVNHLHTTPIVILMKGCLQPQLLRNLFWDFWHITYHVWTQRIDVQCMAQSGVDGALPCTMHV